MDAINSSRKCSLSFFTWFIAPLLLFCSQSQHLNGTMSAFIRWQFFFSTEHKMRSDKSQNIEFYTSNIKTRKNALNRKHSSLVCIIWICFVWCIILFESAHANQHVFGLRFFTLLFDSLRLKCFARVTKNKTKLFDENWRWFRISCSQRTKHNVTTKWRAIIIHFSCEPICLSLVCTLFCV